MRTPAAGCTSSIFSSKVSAGGQLEQPSAVNNSTSTGTAARSTAGPCASRAETTSAAVVTGRMAYQAILTPMRATRGADGTVASNTSSAPASVRVFIAPPAHDSSQEASTCAGPLPEIAIQ